MLRIQMVEKKATINMTDPLNVNLHTYIDDCPIEHSDCNSFAKLYNHIHLANLCVFSIVEPSFFHSTIPKPWVQICSKNSLWPFGCFNQKDYPWPRPAIPYTAALQCEFPRSVYRCLSRLKGERYTGLLYVKTFVAKWLWVKTL